jgi:hypothetical protein
LSINTKPEPEREQTCDDVVEPLSRHVPNALADRHVASALDPFGRELVRPGEEKREHEPYCKEQHHRSKKPRRRAERGQQKTRDLREQPSHDQIRDRDLDDVALPELAGKRHRTSGVVCADSTGP